MMPVKQFIALHSDSYYCEAIMDPWGRLEDACPSHQEDLIYHYCIKHNVTREELFDGWDPSASPLHWIAEDLNYGVIWYSFVILPLRFTHRQIATLRSLIGSMTINLERVDVSMEQSLIRLHHKMDVKGIKELCEYKEQRLKEAKERIWIKTER